jgi:tRNA pseudouridine55 synthase
MFGLLNIDKPPRMTSRVVVNRVLKLVWPEKVGHAGTLDPLATGVVVVCLGKATRLVPWIQAQPKVYQATFVLGRTSDTDDVQGRVVELAGAPAVTRDDLASLLPRFVGRIEQVPPQFSAVKIRGRRAYKLALRGKRPALPARPVEVFRIDLTRFVFPEFSLEVECGSGTYVRAIGRDIGRALGSGVVLSDLRRTRIGAFQVEDAVPISDVTAESLPQQLLPARMAVCGLPQLVVSDDAVTALCQGRMIQVADDQPVASGDTVAALTREGDLVALIERRLGRWQPRQVFL